MDAVRDMTGHWSASAIHFEAFTNPLAAPRADDIPPVHLETRSVPTAVNPLGVKGVGEAGTVGSLVATINAICDALSPLGIRHIEMPATPARVWAAIQEAKRADSGRP